MKDHYKKEPRRAERSRRSPRMRRPETFLPASLADRRRNRPCRCRPWPRRHPGRGNRPRENQNRCRPSCSPLMSRFRSSGCRRSTRTAKVTVTLLFQHAADDPRRRATRRRSTKGRRQQPANAQGQQVVAATNATYSTASAQAAVSNTPFSRFPLPPLPTDVIQCVNKLRVGLRGHNSPGVRRLKIPTPTTPHG